MKKVLVILFLFSSTQLFSQEINVKSNIISAFAGVPSLSIEGQVFKKSSISVGYYR